MKTVNLCVPVLKRYDLLAELLQSVQRGTLVPDKLYVVNNGHDRNQLAQALQGFPVECVCMTPVKSMGVAESWNWFIKNVPEERVIVNDDIRFSKRSLQTLVETKGDIVSGLAEHNACSCFIIRDSCIEKVGLFDETISPRYAYFEDCDYAERLHERQMDFVDVDCGVVHGGSQTLAKFTPYEMQEHHRKFIIAQENFITKWGRMPHGKIRQFA